MAKSSTFTSQHLNAVAAVTPATQLFSSLKDENTKRSIFVKVWRSKPMMSLRKLKCTRLHVAVLLPLSLWCMRAAEHACMSHRTEAILYNGGRGLSCKVVDLSITMQDLNFSESL